MFSPERIIHNFLETTDKSFASLSWRKLFKEFFYILYFQKHLSFHFLKPYKIIICLGANTNLEVLTLLQLLSQKYSFFQLRKPNRQNINIDFEQNYLLNSSLNEVEMSQSNLCVLIGVNTRYEGSKLNLKLKSRYSKGNFKILNIGSLINLTFSNTNISSNIKILKYITEGNSFYCQEFVNSLQPIFITSTEILKRNDSFGLTTMLTTLTEYVKIVSQSNQSYLNFLNPTLNDSGFLNFKNIKPIQNNDLKTSSGVFFINNSFETSNIKKLLNLKLLNFFKNNNSNGKILLTQNNNINVNLITQFKQSFNLKTHLHLPKIVIGVLTLRFLKLCTYGCQVITNFFKQPLKVQMWQITLLLIT